MSHARKYDNEYRRMADWVAEYNVHPEFIHFPHREHNPWDLLLECRDLFDSLPDYNVTWTFGDTENHGAGMDRDRMLRYGAVLGSYPIREPSYKAHQFTNPQYVNEIPQSCTADPLTHIQRCGELGVVSGRNVSRMFSKSHGWTWKRCHDAGVDWDALRSAGRVTMGNTLSIAKAWSDLSVRDIGRALGISAGTVSKYLNDYAELDTVPEPPHEKWI